MDNNYEENGSYLRNFLVSASYVALTVLLGLHLYLYIWGPPAQDPLQGDFNFALMQLTRGLAEVNRKHEYLLNEVERIRSVFPAVAAAASRAKDALEPSYLRKNNRQSIDLYDYDRQIVDYALESAGGGIVDTGDSVEHILYESPAGWLMHVFTGWFCRDCNGARAMIRPSTLPGECWAFKGSHAEAVIRLLGTVLVSGLSVEHISANMSPTKEIHSAPRIIQLEGLKFRGDPYPHDFGSFEYDKNGKPIQYFPVIRTATRGFNLMRFRVVSNWGDPVYTCVYRVRIHGELAPGQVSDNVVTDHGDH